MPVAPVRSQLQDGFASDHAGQDQDSRRGTLPTDAPGRLQTIEQGHESVHQHHVGLGKEHLLDGGPSVVRLADDLDTVEALQGDRDHVAQKGVVVGDENAKRGRRSCVRPNLVHRC